VASTKVEVDDSSKIPN